MENSVGSFFSGVGQLIGKTLGHPLDFLSGKSCNSVCTATWDFICYIENFCVAQLLKFVMVAFLVYFVLLFFYLLFSLGICQCILRTLCHIVWSFFLYLCLSTTFLLHLLFQQASFGQEEAKERRRRICCTSSSEDDYELAEMSTFEQPRDLERGRSQLSRRKNYKDERLRRSLRPNSHRARVELSGNSDHPQRKNIHKNVDDHVRVKRSSKFSQKGSRHRTRTHHRR